MALVVAVAVGAGTGWHWWTTGRFLQSTDDAYVESDTTVISPKVEGYLREVRVKENQSVAAGQVLFVVDDRDFAARAAQAEATVATGEATVTTFASRLDLQHAMIDQAAATVQSSEADLNRTQLDYKRYTALVSADFASRQRFETAEADSRKAAAALEKARAALVAQQNQMSVLGSQKHEEEARLMQARAALRLARNDLDNTVIRAPVAGVAGNRAGRVGMYVKPGTQLLSLVPLPYVYVTANFKETQLTHMRPGQAAEVSVDAYPDQLLTGRLESFAPASGAQFSLLPPDNATGNFTKIVQRVPIRIALPADSPLARLLRPGLSVTVTIDTRSAATDIAVSAPGLIGAAQAQPASDNALGTNPGTTQGNTAGR
ncbi:MAG TPA: HlyD family secretion protein [Stellaceae bacterium]|nr:HlyD family secretion protein [Stellaceae bacterium]